MSRQDLVISHRQRIHFNLSNLCGSILENTGRAGTGLWPTLEGLEQARLLSVKLPKLLVFKTSFFFFC